MKKLKLFFIIFIITIFSVNVCAQNSQLREISELDFKVFCNKLGDTKKIRFGYMDSADLLSLLLDEPANKSIEDNSSSPDWSPVFLKWDGLEIKTFKEYRYIISLTITKPLYTTIRGATIGTSKDEIRNVYGKPNSESSSIFVYKIKNPYDPSSSPWQLAFVFKNNIVQEISMESEE